MEKPLKVDHIGIAVRSIKDVLKIYESLGLKVERIEEVKEEKVIIAMIRVGETRLELLEPLNEECTVAKFIEKRGEGLHHIAFSYGEIRETGRELSSRGLKLVYEEPKVIPGKREINFIHPGATHGVLLEIVKNYS